MKKAFKLFLTFFKIGLFTFGGGYAMISIIQNEFVEKKKWISQDELLDILAVAESTPGPIAINSATYIGYKQAGILGSIFSTLGVALPSFIIIYIISLFLNNLLDIEIVANAFKGIKVGVSFLIFTAALKMVKNLEKTPYQITLFILSVIAIFIINFFALNISAIWIILSGAILGIIYYGFIIKKEGAK